MASPPRYGTPRRPDRPTLGAAARGVALALGQPLMPWQAHALDVALEVDPATGRLAYSTVILSVPRRGGKSLATLVAMLTRAMFPTPQRIWYAAQSGKNVTKKWRQEWEPAVSASPLAGKVRARLSQGNEEFVVDAGGGGRSFVSAFSASREDLHSQSGDMIVFDEAWVHSAADGVELLTAARPLMATRPGAQLWIVSAAGDIDSTWWAEWIETGRTAASVDMGRGVCHLEWSADVKGLDLDDPAVWLDTHPAVISDTNPAGTIDLEFLTDEHTLAPATFARSYLNITDRSASTSAAINAETWGRLAAEPFDRSNGVVLGIDSGPEQATTAIVAAGHVDDLAVLEVVDVAAGTGWVPARCAELADRFPVTAVAVDPGSPAGALVAPLRRAGLPVVDLQLRDVTAAAAQFVEAVRTGTIRHVPHPLLDAAVAGARRRKVGDGAWAFGRVDSTMDVSALIAATFARYALETASVPGVS